MSGVIVVDACRSRSTCHGRDAYIHDHFLRYRHNFAPFYQLLDSNLFTRCRISERDLANSDASRDLADNINELIPVCAGISKQIGTE